MRIVAIHGVGQQHKGPRILHAEWWPALLDGLTLAGAPTDGVELTCAFYGDLFRPAGQEMGLPDPPYDVSDVDNNWEAALLAAWWQDAAQVDPAVPDPDGEVMARTPCSVQRALDALSGSRFFAGMADRALVFDLKQLHAYLRDPRLRAAARARVASAAGPGTHVLIGHSLGAVVAYEVACANPNRPVHALVTLGAPLGIRNLVFDRLDPSPTKLPSGNWLGCWPGGVAQWTNICDIGDVVALVKDLRPCFGDRVRNITVDNGARAHDVRRYLTAKETGRAIAEGLGIRSG